jgi:hypothetical protein
VSGISRHGTVNTAQPCMMENSSPVSKPMATCTKLCKSTDESTPADQKQYQLNIGSQMYDMLSTRRDLAYTISQISTNPSTVRETAGKRSLRYLNETRNFGIMYDGSKGLVLEGDCDVDYARLRMRDKISLIAMPLFESQKTTECRKNHPSGEILSVRRNCDGHVLY